MRPTGRLAGDAAVPGDKSITHRAILLAAIADGPTTIHRYLPADDCLRSLAAVEALGVAVARDATVIRIAGKGPDALREPAALIDLGNSGTSLRLLTGLLAAQPLLCVLTGDASLRRRPMRRLIEPLRQMGAEIVAWGGGDRAPVVVRGHRPLKPLRTSLPVASAQLKSALLLAGLSAAGITEITEPARSRDHTERLLPQFGAALTMEGTAVGLAGPQRLRGAEIEVVGDLSSAAFLVVAATIVPSSAAGTQLRLAAVGVNPTRTGLLELLGAMGAKIAMTRQREQSGEPVADLTVQPSALGGLSIGGDRIVALIDEFPILCVAAAVATGETVIRDAEELRLKESDRIAVMATELRKFGVQIDELPDGVRITGGRPLRGAVGSSHGDHRIAMALAVAGLVAEGETRVDDVDCIETSFPGFAETLRRLGADVTVVQG